MIDLGKRKHLFIDDALIDRAEGLAFRINPPRVGGVAIARDRAWEHHIHWGHTVVDDGGLAKMWYATTPPGSDHYNTFRWMYAESLDGTRWTKPELGLVAVNGSSRTNLLPYGRHQPQVFIDPTASSELRYKSFGRNTNPDIGPLGFGLLGSADGLTFRAMAANGITLMGDTQNMAMWDERVGRYVAYVRAYVTNAEGQWLRAVARWETDDLTSRDGWSLDEDPLAVWESRAISRELPVVLAPDSDDPPETDFYSPSVVKYPGADDVYVATPSVYRHFARDEIVAAEPPRNDGLMEIQLAVSRDGITWRRPDRAPYVRLDPSGPGSQMVYSGLGMVLRGDSIYQYHIAYDQSHGLKRRNNPAGQIRWTEQRLDGFMALAAGSAGGEFVTEPLRVKGDRLELNLDASASGDALVELQDADGRPLEGYAAADGDRVLGNRIRHAVTWHGRSTLALPDEPIRVRIVMRACRLFALQFTSPPH